MLAGQLRHHLLRRFVEAYDDLHHPDGLGQWAHEVILREAVLLQEILRVYGSEGSESGRKGSSRMIFATSKVHFWSSDSESLPTNLARQRADLTKGKRLDDLLQVIFLLQDLLHLLLKHALEHMNLGLS